MSRNILHAPLEPNLHIDDWLLYTVATETDKECQEAMNSQHSYTTSGIYLNIIQSATKCKINDESLP